MDSTSQASLGTCPMATMCRSVGGGWSIMMSSPTQMACTAWAAPVFQQVALPMAVWWLLISRAGQFTPTCWSLLTQLQRQQARALHVPCGAKLYTAQRSCLGPADRNGFSKEKQDRKDPVILRKKHQHIPPDKQLRDERQKRLPKPLENE